MPKKKSAYNQIMYLVFSGSNNKITIFLHNVRQVRKVFIIYKLKKREGGPPKRGKRKGCGISECGQNIVEDKKKEKLKFNASIST